MAFSLQPIHIGNNIGSLRANIRVLLQNSHEHNKNKPKRINMARQLPTSSRQKGREILLINQFIL